MSASIRRNGAASPSAWASTAWPCSSSTCRTSARSSRTTSACCRSSSLDGEGETASGERETAEGRSKGSRLFAGAADDQQSCRDEHGGEEELPLAEMEAREGLLEPRRFRAVRRGSDHRRRRTGMPLADLEEATVIRVIGNLQQIRLGGAIGQHRFDGLLVDPLHFVGKM